MTARREVFAYIVCCSSRGTEFLVFDSLDEAGVDAPKGGVEPAETPEAALRVVDELGIVRYRDEEQPFFWLLGQVDRGAP